MSIFKKGYRLAPDLSMGDKYSVPSKAIGWNSEIFFSSHILLKQSVLLDAFCATTSEFSSFLARGLSVPLLPRVLLVLPIISHSLGPAFWSLAFMAG